MYLKLFFTFLKIGIFTIGGGYAMLPLIEREVVRQRWMEKKDFYDLFSIAQSLPGVFAVNIAVFTGYKLKKIGGSLVCALGTILPSFVIMLLIALFFTRIQDNEVVERIFKGLRPAVVALIVVPCISAAQATGLTFKTALIPLVSLLLIWILNISPAYVILAAAVGGILYRLMIKRD
jgi:Chromate transport protein ChrA